MVKKFFIFLAGMLVLSIAWVNVTSSVKGFQTTAQKENMPVKFNLLQSKWTRLAGFNAAGLNGVKKPAKFIFKFSGLDLNLTDSEVAKGVESELYLNAKKAYLDSGVGVIFYTLESPSTKQNYLVRSQKIGENLELVGFSLDTVLNYLGSGLGSSEWFLINGKKRVLASDEKAYVGKSYRLNKLYETFSFDVGGDSFLLAVLKPKGVNLAMTNFMGLLGIALVLIAIFLYTGDGVGFNNAKLGLGFFAQENLETEPSLEVEKGLFADDMEEDVRMVDLTGTSASSKVANTAVKLDYAEFLIDNPILEPGTEDVVAAPVEEEPEEPIETKRSKKAEGGDDASPSSADDWVKLAEELSASIDQFTQTLETEKALKVVKAEA